MALSKPDGNVLLDEGTARENLGRASSLCIFVAPKSSHPRRPEELAQCGFAQAETFPESSQGPGWNPGCHLIT